MIYSHEVGCLKPDARIYHLVCDLLEVAPEEAVSLDDVQANVDGAKPVGIRGSRLLATCRRSQTSKPI
jgi:HAD superfamily hydrolase (TIGR01509 family)